MHRALFVEVDFRTGERAGEIDPKDENLQCYNWQSLPSDDGDDVELRLVEDDRDLSQYEDVDGVTVLEGKEAINQKIKEMSPDDGEWFISSEVMFNTYIQSQNVDIDQYPEEEQAMLEQMANDGVRGIEYNEPDVNTL